MSWWENAVGYEVYLRSYADSDNNGTGDFAGLTAKLDYIASIGVDAVWVTPFYPSPQADFGYDVADYRDVDPNYGTLDDFDFLVRLDARDHRDRSTLWYTRASNGHRAHITYGWD